MATMTLKNIPDSLYRALKQNAERHRRSINSEAIVCLERALTSERIDPETALARARAVRSRAPDVFVTDQDLRTARDRGRP
jgi:antitoxin FitA